MSLKLVPFVANQAALPTGAQFVGYLFGVVDDDGLGHAGLRVYNGVTWSLIDLTNSAAGGGGGGAVASVTAGAGLINSGSAANPVIDAVSGAATLTIAANNIEVAASIVSGAAAGATAVQPARQVLGGAGLTGGGSLSADQTLNVANADGSLAIGANDVAVSAGIQAGAALGTTAVQPARQIIAGAGLTGGGTLAADRTLDVVAADATIVVAPDSVRVGVISSTNVDGTIATEAGLEDVDLSIAAVLDALQFQTRILRAIDDKLAVQSGRLPYGGDESGTTQLFTSLLISIDGHLADETGTIPFSED